MLKNSSTMMKFLFPILLTVSYVSPTISQDMCILHPPPKYWDVYEEMKLATSDDLKYYATMLFAPIPFQDLPNSVYKHQGVLDKINTDKSGLPCIKKQLLNAYCSIVHLNKPEIKPWIGQIPSMYSFASNIRTKNDIESWIPIFIPKLVYMRYAAIQALPAIANAFYTKALKC
jgi:hypothetical protein